MTKAQRIVELHEAGIEGSAIAERVGVSRAYVSSVMSRHKKRNKIILPVGRPNEPRCDEMARLRAAGKTYRDIADEFQVTEQAVYRACKRRAES